MANSNKHITLHDIVIRLQEYPPTSSFTIRVDKTLGLVSLHLMAQPDGRHTMVRTMDNDSIVCSALGPDGFVAFNAEECFKRMDNAFEGRANG